MDPELTSLVTKVANSLDQISKLKAFELMHSDEYQDTTNAEKIVLLDRMGFIHNDIVAILGTTIGTVNKELSVSRKKLETE